LEPTGNSGAAWGAAVRRGDGTDARLSHLLVDNDEIGVRISGSVTNHRTVRNSSPFGFSESRTP
jgi:hypothetical protein